MRAINVAQRVLAARGLQEVEVAVAAACSSAVTLPAAGSEAAALAADPCISGRQRDAWQHVGRRSLHTSRAACQQQQQPADAPSATALSGMAAALADGDPFLNQLDARSGPGAAYKKLRLEGTIRKDARQEATVVELQRVYSDLADRADAASGRSGSGLTLLDAAPAKPAKGGWFGGLFGGGGAASSSSAASPVGPALKGLYMYGGVGVGKTFLMDLLANNPPHVQLARTHFHDFMIDVHTKLRHYSKLPDPLSHVADEIADQTELLCLDELFVTDVADAMILHRLFARLWDRGLVLVATSNRHPDALYEGGLQRNLFLPFIHRLKAECVIHDMESQTDYRRLAHHHRGLYFVTPDRDQILWERFVELTNNQPIRKAYVDVAMGRQLELPRTGGCVAYFRFPELCDRPLAAADYIALANGRHSVVLEGVPVFDAGNRSAAYRFVTLVDVLYEHRIRFLCSAEAMPFELFENIKTQQQAREDKQAGRSSKDEVVDDNLGFAKDRTISRLTEMQSSEYLRAHAKAHAPELLLALKNPGQRKGHA